MTSHEKALASILIVDDEASIRQALRVTLGAQGFDVSEAATGEQALALIRAADASHYDAVLLDMNMPGMGGMMTCREIRRLSPRLPILMLTIRDNQDDKVEALDSGADDYVTKPFHMRELTARVRAAIRRAHTVDQPPASTIKIGDIVLDPERREVTKASQTVHLTPKEFDLLQYFMSNPGKPLSHSRLLTAVWGSEYGGELEYLRTFVRQLRKKLEDDPSQPTYLVTEMWFGYRFRAES
ncbi:MAG TPA: response regulator transcription factor [Bryobacteraceae bacterium]|nr:response regulator transcription factor [Bryobacteraceae bacterium]